MDGFAGGDCAEPDRLCAFWAEAMGYAQRQLPDDGAWGPYPEYHHVMADPEGNEFCVH